MKGMKRAWCGLGAAIGAVVVAAFATVQPAAAQNWPTDRVVILVPFGAGSVTDILARIFAEEMSARWKQQVIVENQPGLAGTTRAAKSRPDGHTLMVTSNGHTVGHLVTKNPTFHPVKDFSGITRLASAPLFMIQHPDVKARSVKEFIALAKQQPGKLNFSSPGLASTTFLAGAEFRRTAGINLVHVPYRSSPDAVTAVMRGDVAIYFAPVNLARDQSESGKILAVAAATPKRIPQLPNVPTFKEAGLDFTYDSWFGLVAQSGVPREILERIADDWAEVLKSDRVQERLKTQYLTAHSDRPADFDKVIAEEVSNRTKIFKEAGIGGG